MTTGPTDGGEPIIPTTTESSYVPSRRGWVALEDYENAIARAEKSEAALAALQRRTDRHDHAKNLGQAVEGDAAIMARLQERAERAERERDEWREEVERQGKFLHCTNDRGDGTAHGGAAYCVPCVNAIKDERDSERRRVEELEHKGRLLCQQNGTLLMRLAIAEKALGEIAASERAHYGEWSITNDLIDLARVALDAMRGSEGEK